MRRLIQPLADVDSVGLVVAGFATLLVATWSARSGSLLGLGLLIGICAFIGVLIAFVKVPHVAIACLIPYFSLLPMLKVLVSSQLAPSKDLVEIAAFAAAAVVALQRRSAGRSWNGDRLLLILVVILLGLYVVDIGGMIRGGGLFGLAWFHGVRLVGEPMLLLLVGLTLVNPRKTLHWSVISLIVTTCLAAVIGLIQQKLGGARLVQLGYSYDVQVRTIGGRLRSFGPFDEPFDYAAMLAFGLAGILLWVRRATVTALLGPIVALGLLASFVRGAALSVVALLALLFAKKGHSSVATILLAVSAAAAVAFVMTSTQPTAGRVVQAGPSTYLTLNGRSRSWHVALGNPSTWAFGRGVGLYGTAAERAARSKPPALGGKPAGAADSGYLATMSDIGFIGLAILLAIFGRIILLLSRAIRRGQEAAWFGLGLIIVFLLDAALRSSLTGFPTAHVAMLLVGLTLAAVQESNGSDSEANRREGG